MSSSSEGLLVAASRISSAMAQTVFASMAKLGAPKCFAVLELLGKGRKHYSIERKSGLGFQRR